KYNPETVNAILDVMQKELEAEENRDSFVLNKTNTVLTVSGVLLAAISFLIHDFGGILPGFVLLILVIGALCLFCSILVSLFIIRATPFERIDFNVLVGELKQDSLEVKSRLIATYKEILGKNSKIVGHKVILQWYSTLLIIAGAFLIISSIIYLYIAGPKHL
ncbi:MAG TPA: hypothetical protein ACFYD1_09330, partial [Candidatus Hypogeohydataceae bacterium YC38]